MPILAPPASPVPAPTQCVATCVFERMQRAVNVLPYPAYIAFTFEDNSTIFTHPSRELLRVLVRTDDGVAVMTVLRDIPGNTLPKPRASVVANKLDFLEVSTILRLGDFPLADFGLRYVRPARPDFFEGSDAEATPANLRVIATVMASQGLAYQIADRGVADIGGRPCYHLKLTPLRNPKHNVLREIWIDTVTNLPVRYIAERFVENYPGDDYSYFITVDARNIDGYLVNVAAEGANAHLGGTSKWHISDVSFPNAEPNWVFDREQWKIHNGEPIPSLAPSQYL
jgi:hypothetical protein